MNPDDQKLADEAFQYVKNHSDEIIQRFVGQSVPVATPVSLFMAGSPGAGKTEVSKNFVKKFNDVPVRIDADDIRPLCPGYTGANAHLFQKAVNKGVNLLYDYALHHNLNCILDGTFAYAGAEENIERSLVHKRRVELWFVYQDPVRAWEFTKAREAQEARHVSKDVFVRAVIESRRNARAVKERFKGHVELNLLVKDYEDGREDFQLNISGEELDRRTEGHYTEEELEKILI